MGIAQERGIADQVNDFARKQKSRDYSGTIVLIETMMRAMQTRFIDPKLNLQTEYPASIDRKLIDEHEQNGFELIFKFDSVIKRHKEHPKGTLAEDIISAATYLIGEK